MAHNLKEIRKRLHYMRTGNWNLIILHLKDMFAVTRKYGKEGIYIYIYIYFFLSFRNTHRFDK